MCKQRLYRKLRHTYEGATEVIYNITKVYKIYMGKKKIEVEFLKKKDLLEMGGNI